MELITTKEVLKLIKCGRNTLLAIINTRDFPQPIFLTDTSRTRHWRLADVEAWIAAQ